MTRDERLRDIFDRATNLPRPRRAAFIEETLADDTSLLGECQRLLVAYQEGIEDEEHTTSAQHTSTDPNPLEEPLNLQQGQLFGSYRVVRALGHGGMGEVYEADHLEHGRRVALKILRASNPSHADRLRFLREGRLAGAISHPNTVYIYGTEEIDDRQVIVMEFVTSGTLRDAVLQSGPLALHTAVTAVLDVVEGLSAALQKGILHRDVKPSNCFVESTGRVKIGDFGLSIPSTASDETKLTQVGLILATPAFSSPEQLQGDVVDARSDIYSVGATLFYVLTGKAPYEDTNLVRLLARAINAPTPSPRALRRDIPKDLAAIVLKCLEKQPANRFQTYEELRDALCPHSGRHYVTASMVTRAFAGLIDVAIVMLAWRLAGAILEHWTMRLPSQLEVVVLALVGSLVAGLYFALLEGTGLRSVGKLACGLRIHRAIPGVPTIASICCRTTVFVAAVWLIPVGLTIVGSGLKQQPLAPLPRGKFPGPVHRSAPAPITTWSLVSIALLFSTARRSNGYQGLHEHLSRTRTNSEARSDPEVVVVAGGPPPTAPRTAAHVGPYDLVGGPIRSDQASGLLAAFDPVLQRAVWILITPPGTAPVSAARRSLDRPTRLRWLAGQRSTEGSWDAFERVDGAPLVQVGSEGRPYAFVRTCLRNVAKEIELGAADRTLTALAINRLWLTPSGGLKVLDAALADLAYENGHQVVSVDLAAAQTFLRRVADRLLGTGVRHAGPAASPLPPSALRILRRLDTQSFGTLHEISDAFAQAASRDIAISHWRRAAPMLAAAVIVALVFQTNFVRSARAARLSQNLPSYFLLHGCLEKLRRLDTVDQGIDVVHERAVSEQCVAIFSREVDDESLARWQADSTDRRLIASASSRFPNVSRVDIGSIRGELPQGWWLAHLDQASRNDTGHHYATTYALMMLRRLAALAAAASILLAFTFRRGIVFSSLGMSVVSENGDSASRTRAATRAAFAWAPLVLSALLTLLTCPKPDPPLEVFGLTSVAWASAPFLIAAVIGAHSVLHPHRGFAERLTGTWLVRE